MREIILQRIQELSSSIDGWNNGRDKSTMRWKNFQQFGEHISQINFNELSDNNLLIVYERIIRQLNKQM